MVLIFQYVLNSVLKLELCGIVAYSINYLDVLNKRKHVYLREN